MTTTIKSNSDGSSAIQTNGVDRIQIDTSGNVLLANNPITGNRSKQVATMQKFSDEFPVLTTLEGYQKLPNGLIIQWGIVTSTGNGYRNFTWNYPIPFTTVCLTALCTVVDDGSLPLAYSATSTLGTTSGLFTAYSQTAYNLRTRVFAIGY